MAVSSEKFELFEDDLENLSERVRSNLDLLQRKGGLPPDSEDRRLRIQRTRAFFMEIKKIIEDMEAEARMAPIQYRGDMLSKVRQYRESLGRFQTDLRKITECPSPNVDSREENSESFDESQRQQVQQNRSIMERTTQSIVRSQQVAIETEQVGEEIISDLGIQRETLDRTRARLEETNVGLNRSRNVIRKMYANILQNKCLLILIIGTEAAILLALIYWKLFT